VSPIVSRGLGAAFAGLAALGLAGLSQASYRVRLDDGAVVRLAWRARPERIETCRTPSQAELARLPVHMRQQVVCDGVSARYRLRVALDGAPLLEETIRGSGLRHDRPMYLLRDLPAAPGRHDLEVRFERVDSVPANGEAAEDSVEANASTPGIPGRRQREAEERLRRRLEATPPVLVLHRGVDLAARQVLVVSYDPERRELILLGSPAR
jgi:hypothetical protein